MTRGFRRRGGWLSGKPLRLAWGSSPRNNPSPGPEEKGAVTAELAVAMPAAVLLLAGMLTGAAAGITQLRLEEAARAAARQVMRGEAAAAEATVARLAGPRAALVLSADGEWVQIRVESTLNAPLLEHLPITLSAQAAALPENPP